MYNCDHNLFLSLYFKGGEAMDSIMLLCSGKLTWVPLYLLIIYLVWRKVGWKNMLIFIALVVTAVALTDIVAGIFKHTGLLKNVLPNFTPRLRPMYDPSFEGVLHVVKWGGRYGTISAHAATTAAIALLAGGIIRKHWFTLLASVWVALVCYSRIYLAYHFPLDILWGLTLGLTFGGLMLLLYNRIKKQTP
ncbi:MAG: phosphatase PAP2 family protein [Alistipes sp.]